MTFKERLTYWGFRLAWWIGAHWPEVVVRKIFSAAAEILWRGHGASVRRLEFNLARVIGQDPGSPAVRQLSRRGLDSYFHYWTEMFVLSSLSVADIFARTELRDEHYLQQALDRGKGVMFAATHSGSWDVAAARMAHQFGPVMTVAERLKPEALFQMFTQSREAFGFNIVPHVGGLKPPTEALTERLLAGGIVGLASDRDLKGRGVKVSLFGSDIRMPLGAVRLARSTGAALLPAAMFYEGDVTVIQFYPEIDFEGLNERGGYEALATVFEQILAAHPEAWHMLQQVWLDHPKSWGGNA